MSFIGDAIGAVTGLGGLLGGDDAPPVPQAKPIVPYKTYQSQYDDPATKAMWQQAFADNGLRLNETGGEDYYSAIKDQGGWFGRGRDNVAKDSDYYASLNQGKNLNQAQYDDYVRKYGQAAANRYWKKGQTERGLSVEQGDIPAWVAEIKQGYMGDYNRMFDQTMQDLARRGVRNSGTGVLAGSQLAADTQNSINQATEARQLAAFNKLRGLRGDDRQQQSAEAANDNGQNAMNYNQQMQSYNAQYAQDRDKGEDLASIFEAFPIGGKKKATTSAQTSNSVGTTLASVPGYTKDWSDQYKLSLGKW